MPGSYELPPQRWTPGTRSVHPRDAPRTARSATRAGRARAPEVSHPMANDHGISRSTGGRPMPIFETPEAVSLTLELGVGEVRIVASDRDDTVVEVQPSDPAKKSDVAAARQTSVEYANGTVLVKA